MEFTLSTSDIDTSSMSLPSPRSLAFLFPHFGHDLSPGLGSPKEASHSLNASPQGLGGNGQLDAIDYTSQLWNTDTFWEDYLRPSPMSLNLSISDDASQAIPQIPQDREDEAERIANLFYEQTCHTLTMDEDPEQNPWKNLIWPLAKDHPAVYHAIAAMTCFGMSTQQTQLQLEGTRQVHRSTQLLAENVGKGEIALDAALAATLALGFAETWDDQNTTGGANHIRAGGILLQQILINRGSTVLYDEEEARINFLAHTWTYMDVLGRFTCSDLSQPYGNIPNPDLSHFSQTRSFLDPLMGYSTTFFLIMRRVADLINKVRARETNRNSPAIISQAIEIRRAIEQWTLPIDLETIDDPSQTMIDAIQTAEAYRWSALMMLYQAVPELPNLTSYGELAQKILVYLATIPLSSTTIIAHIFPLMVAGCDAVEEEDRQFVRERWAAMAARMVPSLIDRCIKVTEELWKRREEYLFKRGLAFTSNGVRINAASNEAVALSKDIASFIDLGTKTAERDGRGRKGNDFPISAAFRKGVDMLTRSGCTEYTVRGRLHWLGVMRDWDWQGRVSLL